VKKIILFAYLFTFKQFVHAQYPDVEVFKQMNPSAKKNASLDSLKKLLFTRQNDTSKVLLLCRISNIYMWSSPDSALDYSVRGLKLAQEVNFEEGLIKVYHSIGEALAVKGNYAKALEIQLKALHLSEKLNNQIQISLTYLWLGLVYLYSADNEKALSYFNMVKSNKELYEKNQELIFTLIGRIYFGLNKLDSALFYSQKGYNKELEEKNNWCFPFFSMAAINEKLGRRAQAINYYRNGLNVAFVKSDIILGYNSVARIFKELGIADSAIYYAKKAIGVAQKESILPGIAEASSLLKDIFSANHNIDSAFKYEEILLSVKDSVFSQERIKQMQNLSDNEELQRQEAVQQQQAFQTRIKLYSLLGALTVFLIIAIILYRNNQQKQKAYRLLQNQKQEIDFQKSKTEQTLEELKSTQSQLIQSEKMASLGELTAGIAHEIQNPLNFVNNFSEVNKELIGDLKEEIKKGNIEEVNAIADDIEENEEKINHHGRRADAIVKGMLQHSSVSTGQKESTDINALADEYLRLSYHGVRAKHNTFSATLQTDFDKAIVKINIVPQDLGRVLLNLYNNAFYAVIEKKKREGESYEPTVTVSTKRIDGGQDKVIITVRDNGNGISQKLLNKIFQPFFTTKPTGQGTGLGLSFSYDIIKAHGGEIRVDTKEGEFAEFIIQLPYKA